MSGTKIAESYSYPQNTMGAYFEATLPTKAEGDKPLDQWLSERNDNLSYHFQKEISNCDMMMIFFKLLELNIKSCHFEKLARNAKWDQQIKHMEKIVQEYKEQGEWQLYPGIASAICGFLAAASPLASYTCGDWLLEKASDFSESIRGMRKKDFFKWIDGTLQNVSKSSDAMGRIQQPFSQGCIARDQTFERMAQAKAEELTSSLQDLNRNFQEMQSAIERFIQMNHEACKTIWDLR